MTTQATDLDILKNIPGYNAILKAVLKSQIQLLVEQLSDQTGEESIILTASINDGTLSHLGSHTGKGFLEGRDEIKSQFLGFCLKSHHRKKVTEQMPSKYSEQMPSIYPEQMPTIYPSPRGDILQSSPGIPIQQFQPAPKRQRLTPTQMSVPLHLNDTIPPDSRPRLTISNDIPVPASLPSRTYLSNLPGIDNGPEPCNTVKFEKHDTHDHGDETPVSRPGFPSAIDMDHTQTSANSGNTENSDQNDDASATNIPGSDSSQDSTKIVKIEPGTSDVDLEITNIEMGHTPASAGAESWGHGQMPFGSPTEGEDTDQSGLDDNTSYNDQDVSAFMSQVLYGRKQQVNRIQGQLIPKILNPTEISITPTNAALNFSTNFITKPPNIKVYWCHYCGKALQNKSLYEYHMRAHRGEKPYTCNICNKKFAGKQVLETHKRLHTGERPFKCKFCETKFAARAGLDYHVKKNHPERLFAELSTSDMSASTSMLASASMDAEFKLFMPEYQVKRESIESSGVAGIEMSSTSVTGTRDNEILSLPVFPGM